MNMIRNFATRGSVALALCLSFSLLQTSAAFGQAPAGAAPQAGPNRAPDPRVQQRKYHFTETNEDLPYSLFVSSKVVKDKKAPLIVALHGVFGDGNALLSLTLNAGCDERTRSGDGSGLPPYLRFGC